MTLARIRTGDTVVVRSGKSAGKSGRVTRLWLDRGLVLIEGVNMIKRHAKPGPNEKKGKIVEREAALPLCKVALALPETEPAKPTRVKTKVNEDRSKNRVSTKAGKVIEAPAR